MVLITRTVGIVVLDKFATQRSIGGSQIRFAGTASFVEPKRNRRRYTAMV